MTRRRRQDQGLELAGAPHEASRPSNDVTAIAVSVIAGGANMVVPGLGIAVQTGWFGLGRGRRRARRLRATNERSVLKAAAEVAGLSQGELLKRLEHDEALHDLLLQTLRDAGDTNQQRKLVAHALNLGQVPTDSAETIQWSLDFRRALAAMDRPHFDLLRRFNKSWDELGLQPGPNWLQHSPPVPLAPKHVEHVADGLPNLPALLATLESQGLIASQTVSGYGTATSALRLTNFGMEFLERIGAIDEALRQH